jgi:hypothetical protein
MPQNGLLLYGVLVAAAHLGLAGCAASFPRPPACVPDAGLRVEPPASCATNPKAKPGCVIGVTVSCTFPIDL